MSVRTKSFAQEREWRGTERYHSGGTMVSSTELGHGLEVVSCCESLRAGKPAWALDSNLLLRVRRSELMDELRMVRRHLSECAPSCRLNPRSPQGNVGQNNCGC